MTALQAMRYELLKISNEMMECVSDEGYLKRGSSQHYHDLIQKHKDICEGIKFLEEMYAEKDSRQLNRIKNFS